MEGVIIRMQAAPSIRHVGLVMILTLLLAASSSSSSDSNPFSSSEEVSRSVSYDSRALLIDGQRQLLISASIHYPRSTPEMWPDLISKAKDGGVDVIESYIFWNAHEPQRGKYDFEGQLDFIQFIKETQKAGLYFHLRIGPYACAEWNYGGFPAWLHFLPGIKFRTDNAVFKAEMERITRKIVDMLREHKLFYWQGGPVILLQIENEYSNIQKPYGIPGKKYMHWAAGMAVGLDTKVPWVMCQQKDAPHSVINTCNGFYCDTFKPNSPKPKMWTENWTGWFLNFGGLQPHRPVEDIAFAVARFFQKGGTFQNYYMYHGGTNFGRSAGGPFIATSYDYDAPIDEYGLLRQPKWGHLKELHKALKLCKNALLFGETKNFSLGPLQEGTVYQTKEKECSAFLSNRDPHRAAKVDFRGQVYELPAWSVSILPDCKTVVFNTAKVKEQTTVMSMAPVDQKNVVPDSKSSLAWKSYKEPVGAWGNHAFKHTGLRDQMNTTRDVTDYMWYTKSIDIDHGVLENGTRPSMSIKSLGHSMLIFLNGQLLGHGYGSYDNAGFQLQLPLQLKEGENEIALLSTTVGLQNYGSFFDTAGTGVDGPIALIEVKKRGRFDLSSLEWTYQIGLEGESLRLHSDVDAANVAWNSDQIPPKYQPMIWYKTTFNSPPGDDPVAVDLMSMGKGHAWVNGRGLGRYWLNFLSSNLGCYAKCDYRGKYDPTKCTQNCGQPSQRWYHIPRSWLKPSGNQLVLLEEIGGDPTQVSFVTRSPATICAHVSERPALELQCGQHQRISSVDFVSYGNPGGSCQNFWRGTCDAKAAMDVVKKACEGKERCSVGISEVSMGEDPCPGVTKSLAIEATCSL